MGFLRKKKDKGNTSIREAKDESMTKESNALASAPRSNSYSNRSSSREVSKPLLVEDEPSKIENLDSGNNNQHNESNAMELYNGESKTTESTDGDQPSQSSQPSASATHGNGKGPWFTSRSIKLFKKAPPANQSAYSGPPRFDWVDIETSAAIKLQSAYRRRMVMAMMEEEGGTTSAVRNSARRRRAAKEAQSNPAQDFVNIFNCCGADFGLGGGNKESYYDMTREMETARYEDKVREKQDRELAVRKSYQKRGVRESLIENVEVVQ